MTVIVKIEHESKLRVTDAKYNTSTRSFLPRDGVHARDNGM